MKRKLEKLATLHAVHHNFMLLNAFYTDFQHACFAVRFVLLDVY